MTEATLPDPAAKPRGSETLLAAALKRARWTIFWERLWPPLAAFATVVGLFLAVSWLGVWLWLPPLARAVGLALFAALAVAAAIPFVFLRMPGAADALRLLDRKSGLTHRPATTIADSLAVSDKDPYSLALWNAHVERARQTARAFKAGLPSPRIAWRDPYAVRGLVLLALIATFLAAGGERYKRIAAAFDWQGVVLPANFRVDAWVIPPLYTGQAADHAAGHPSRREFRPAHRAGRRAGELDAGGARHRQGRSRCVWLRRRDRLEGAGVGALRYRRAPLHHQGGRCCDIARRRRRRELVVQRHSRSAAHHRADQGPAGAAPRFAAVVLSSAGRLRGHQGGSDIRPQGRQDGERRRAASAVRAARFPADSAAGAHQERRRRDAEGFDRSSVGRRGGNDDARRP